MSWLRIDTASLAQPHLLALARLMGDDLRARGLWVTVLLWVGQHVPDGDLGDYAPGDLARAWGVGDAEIGALVASGVLVATGTRPGRDRDATDNGVVATVRGVRGWDEIADGWREAQRSRARRAARRDGGKPSDSAPDLDATRTRPGSDQARGEERRGEDKRGDQDSVVASAPTTAKAKVPKPTLTESQREWVTAVAAAWTEGVEGTAIPAATPPSARTAPRDRLLLTLRETYPDPAEWRAMARALANSTHHRGENERRWVASLPWVLGNKPKLSEWMERGQALATGTAKPAPGPSLALLPAQRVSRPGDASRMLAEMARGWRS